jgi:hypothetical protein
MGYGGVRGFIKVLETFPTTDRPKTLAPIGGLILAYLRTTEKGNVSVKIPLPERMRLDCGLKQETIRRSFKNLERAVGYVCKLPLEFNLTELRFVHDDGTPICHIGDSTNWEAVTDYMAYTADSMYIVLIFCRTILRRGSKQTL